MLVLSLQYFYYIPPKQQKMNQVTLKVNDFHNQLRKQQLNSIMKKARYQALSHVDQDFITHIINIASHQLTPDHLYSLIALVNKDNTNAILHLGNLIIDRIIPKQLLSTIEWNLGTNQKWTWLINVMCQIQFCTEEMFLYIIRKIITKRTNFNLQNALEFLQKSLKINKEPIVKIFKMNHELVIALSNHTFDPNDKISQLSFIIFTIITSISEDEPIIMRSILGDNRIQKMILHGFNKLQNNIRILSCQIANNFLLSKIYHENIALRIIQLALSEKDKVKVEISYYFRAFSESMSENTIMIFIKRHNLLGIVTEYSAINTFGKYDSQIKANALKALSIISKRFEVNYQQEILKQMHRLGVAEHLSTIVDESQQATYFNDQTIGSPFSVNQQNLMKE